MNKHLLILLFILGFCIATGHAQGDPPAVAPVETVFNDTVVFKEKSFAPGFQEKYNGNEFIYQKKAAGKSQWERFVEWLSRLLDDIFTFGEDAQAAPLYVIIVRVIAGLIILFVIYLIVRAILNKEGMWIFGRQRKSIRTEDAMAENIHEMDFGQLVSETKAANNYRLTIRYYYLWLLKKMAAREIIDWHWEKTNSDYIYEIKDSGLKKDFEYLSYLYDYSWYGEFTLDEAAFEKAEKAFRKTLNTL